MFALNTLNVVIGLVFTWTVFSMAAMYIQEWIASRRKWRAKMLETTIGNILMDPALLNQLYNHPVIQSLHSGTNGENKPSYIPNSQFAQAFLDIVSTAGTEASLLQQQLYKIQHEVFSKNKRKKQLAQQQWGLILAMIRRVLVDKSGSAVSDSILNSVSIEMLAFANEYPKTKPVINKALSTVSAMKSEIDSQISAMKVGQGLPPKSTSRNILEGTTALGVTQPRLKQTLDALLITIPEMAWESDLGLEQMRINVEEWYSNTMARLTGWYKRRTQIMTLAIGLFMALLLNVDSLSLASQIWKEPYRINSMMAELESYVNTQTDDALAQADQQGFTALTQLLGSVHLPIGWLSIPQAISPQDGDLAIEYTCALFPVQAHDIYGFQIGNQCIELINTPLPTNTTGWTLKFIGILITSLAVSQGAPFWFDLLKRIINIRFTGLKPVENAVAVG